MHMKIMKCSRRSCFFIGSTSAEKFSGPIDLLIESGRRFKTKTTVGYLWTHWCSDSVVLEGKSLVFIFRLPKKKKNNGVL
jgi:hypothetical protein